MRKWVGLCFVLGLFASYPCFAEGNPVPKYLREDLLYFRDIQPELPLEDARLYFTSGFSPELSQHLAMHLTLISLDELKELRLKAVKRLESETSAEGKRYNRALLLATELALTKKGNPIKNAAKAAGADEVAIEKLFPLFLDQYDRVMSLQRLSEYSSGLAKELRLRVIGDEVSKALELSGACPDAKKILERTQKNVAELGEFLRGRSRMVPPEDHQ